MIVETGKSNILRVGWHAKDPGRTDVAALVQMQSAGRILSSLGEVGLFLKAFKLLDEAYPHYEE